MSEVDSIDVAFFCPVPGCERNHYKDWDGLLKHVRNKHKPVQGPPILAKGNLAGRSLYCYEFTVDPEGPRKINKLSEEQLRQHEEETEYRQVKRQKFVATDAPHSSHPGSLEFAHNCQLSTGLAQFLLLEGTAGDVRQALLDRLDLLAQKEVSNSVRQGRCTGCEHCLMGQAWGVSHAPTLVVVCSFMQQQYVNILPISISNALGLCRVFPTTICRKTSTARHARQTVWSYTVCSMLRSSKAAAFISALTPLWALLATLRRCGLLTPAFLHAQCNQP